MIPRASALVAWSLLAVAAARCGSAPLLAVALMRLGPTASRTLRRFEAGQEITR